MNNQLSLNKKKHHEEITLHVKKIQDLDFTIGELNNQFVRINRERESLLLNVEEKNKLSKELESVKLDYERVSVEKLDLEKKFLMKSEETNSMRTKLLACEEELTSTANREATLKAEIISKDSKLGELSGEIQLVRSLLNDAQKLSLDLSKEISLKNNIINDLEKKIKDNKSLEEIDALKADLCAKEGLIVEKNEDIQALLMKVDNLQKEMEPLILKIETQEKDLVEIQSKFSHAEVEISKLKLNCTDQDQTIKSLYATLHSQNSELKDKNSEIFKLQLENKDLLKEKENNQLNMLRAEKDGAKIYSEADLEAKIQEMKSNYEKKIETYKIAVKKRFAEKLDDMTESIQNENTELKEKLLKEQERNAKLQSDLWKSSDKLLITQEQNRTLLTKLQSRNTFEVPRPPEILSPISRARSMEVLSGRNRGIDNFARDFSPTESVGSPVSSRRSSIRSLPRGMGKMFSFSTGKVFPSAEEDGEVFDNRYLADLKAGICRVPTQEERMSTLQWRNSLCPPHLKSSYPAETQVWNIREDDLKSTSRMSSISASDVEAKKIKVQSSYKKPGPPTPSKTGGQPSHHQGHGKGVQSTPQSSRPPASFKEGVVNESFVLRDHNSEQPEHYPNRPAKGITTPSRIKNLFFSSGKKENSPRGKVSHVKRNK